MTTRTHCRIQLPDKPNSQDASAADVSEHVYVLKMKKWGMVMQCRVPPPYAVPAVPMNLSPQTTPPMRAPLPSPTPPRAAPRSLPQTAARRRRGTTPASARARDRLRPAPSEAATPSPGRPACDTLVLGCHMLLKVLIKACGPHRHHPCF
eukprot:COSAG01_NODE_5834_length_4006_cov_2.108267_4_plen_150_part_00